MVKMPASYLCLPSLSSMRNHFQKNPIVFSEIIDSTENCSCPLSVRNLEFFLFVQLTEKGYANIKKNFEK